MNSFVSIFSSPDVAYVVVSSENLENSKTAILEKLLKATYQSGVLKLDGNYIGPRNEFVSPFSTNAVEILNRAGVPEVLRVEKFRLVPAQGLASFDVMLEEKYSPLKAEVFKARESLAKVRIIKDIASYNREAGLQLSQDEISYLEAVAASESRFLTDAEVYAFSQINSEHCRHKIFRGTFIIDGVKKDKSLFDLIRDTSKKSPELLVSAYKDNVAFIKGPVINRFLARFKSLDAMKNCQTLEVDRSESSPVFQLSSESTVISLKAETHNFPTTVEPFNGASTGSGGEIRDRMAGGRASIPLSGTAVYMTAYPRLDRSNLARHESIIRERDWKYQSPADILVKASNGASDFGNKFGQPLITGSTYTFEMPVGSEVVAYDRVVMLAGGVGFASESDAIKQSAIPGDVLVLLGGDNYRIGMGGGSVSSVDTGALGKSLELSAIQRANPEMQKRVFNVIRTLSELGNNPVKLIHDHGAGGHINCFSELLEEEGGEIYLDALPLGDSTLSPCEILCNESQERMGIVISEDDYSLLKQIAEREGAPCYRVGRITGDKRIRVVSGKIESPFNLSVKSLLGSSPETVMLDSSPPELNAESDFSINSNDDLLLSLKAVLSLEGVGSKDWLTNKVDRSVTGLVALQQCAGPFQLPVNDCGVIALDYSGRSGIASSIGHASGVGLVSAGIGAKLSVCEALTNILAAPLARGLSGVTLSANWMWPCNQEGENARLYEAVKSLSEFCQELGIAVPTGKDSLSMTMRYDEVGGSGGSRLSSKVKAPGTVVVTAVSEVSDVWKSVSADLKSVHDTVLVHVDFCNGSDDVQREYPLAGSAFAQTRAELGTDVLSNVSAKNFIQAFEYVGMLVKEEKVLALHDISSGGIVVSALEMCFAGGTGLTLNLRSLPRAEACFSEIPGVLIQVKKEQCDEILRKAKKENVSATILADLGGVDIQLYVADKFVRASLDELRAVWSRPSFLLDQRQTPPDLARERLSLLGKKPLEYVFPEDFSSSICREHVNHFLSKSERKVTAAILRDKGTNGERELAYALHAAGFQVLDITMHDILSGKSSLSEVSFLAYPGGFSNSDVLGAGRGWAAAFDYNQKAKKIITDFYERPDTLSLGVCNGCQFMTSLGLIDRNDPSGIRMDHNESGKFESGFVSLSIGESPALIFKPLQGSVLGAWIAHGEGRFRLDETVSRFNLVARYNSASYPLNPNGSDMNAAAICSCDGRHVAIMPHIERSFLMWQWPYEMSFQVSQEKPENNNPSEEYSPWMLVFIEAYKLLNS
ncbi:MAG TPA: phosphoribosylformylglycinamidine synthase [Oligoflexia bacterium]|nr:phosphoribosylformylglycinamidine synthase [Oligoflexia bacterium]HMP49256.1 phosphoribosylformylglycinamidine synthase [Oligoflexia bacterium]